MNVMMVWSRKTNNPDALRRRVSEIPSLPREKTRGMIRQWRIVFAASLAVLFFAGCAANKTVEIYWPPPPQKSRIKFVRTFRNQDDFGKGGGEAAMDALLGEKKRRLTLRQPMALAPSRDGKRLYVSDFTLKAVLVFDFDKREVGVLDSKLYPFKKPFGVAVDGKNNVYVADAALKVIRMFDQSGRFIKEITNEKLERPGGIAIDLKRNRIYVADTSSRTSTNHVVHVFDMEGKYLSKFGGWGHAPGKLHFPTYVTVDNDGNIYVTDTLNARIQAFDPDGKYLKKFGVKGDGFGAFDRPKGVALDTFGNVYVVDSTWSNVQIFNEKGQILLFFGGRGGYPGLLNNPTAISIDEKNRIFVADSFNGRVSIYQLINTTAADSFLPLPKKEKKGGAAKKKSTEKAVNASTLKKKHQSTTQSNQ